MSLRPAFRALFFLAIGAFAVPAFAADVSPEAQESARKTYQAGAQAYSDGHYKDAIDLFLEAARIAPNPAFSYNIGLAYEQLGDHDNALRWYRDYLRELPDAPDRADIEPRVRDAEQRLRERGVQQVTVLSTPDGATVTIDGKPVGVTPWTGELTPGRHKLSLMLRNYSDMERMFELPSDHAVDVRSTLSEAAPEAPAAAPTTPEPSKPPAAEPSHSRSSKVGPLTWVAFGIGAAGLGSALAFELARSGAVDSARQAPTNVDGKDDYDRAKSFETLGKVTLGVGAAFTVAGGVLLYLDLSSKTERPSSTTASVGCGAASCGVAVSGKF
jgi:tetratricopeptide (TPR) repeat protein